MRLLLLSNSGEPLYTWCKREIAEFIGNRQVTFISAATVYNPNDYFKTAQKSLSEVGLKFNHLVLEDNPQELISKTEIFLVGGGNTYQLLSQLGKYNLLDKIKQQISIGADYVGLSAGANIVGPNILTTNDWNVAGSTNFEGLNLTPFNINPHYDAPQDKIMTSAEARDERIKEYLIFNKNPVVAIEEETYLEVEGGQIKIGGKGIAKLFVKSKEPKEYKSGEVINFS